MGLPKRPERTSPIPNEPFESPEVKTVRGPYWDMALGSGLEADSNGSVQTNGSEPSEPLNTLYGTNGLVGVGTGLTVGASGEFEAIFCTPLHPDLPVTYPPYGCNTPVNTTGVTNFTDAWKYCSIENFPCVDTSSGINFNGAWSFCGPLTTFPRLNMSKAENLNSAWYFSGISSFPPINFKKGKNFGLTWGWCSSLVTFPKIDISSGEEFGLTWVGCGFTSFPALNFKSATSFYGTWSNCTNLVNFPASVLANCPSNYFPYAWDNCALSQESVNGILEFLDAAGQTGGVVGISGGTSASPRGTGSAAKASLQAKGWTVTTN